MRKGKLDDEKTRIKKALLCLPFFQMILYLILLLFFPLFKGLFVIIPTILLTISIIVFPGYFIYYYFKSIKYYRRDIILRWFIIFSTMAIIVSLLMSIYLLFIRFSTR